jgi:ubiquinone/menaquinone biosynthesis C-methylase UbiE
MATPAVQFDDSAAYERFMGRWSRAVAPVFLDWLQAPPGAAWLDVGCGTGILAQAVLQHCAPGSVDAIDPATAQIDAAVRSPAAGGVRFRVADAQQLPFADGVFDVVASALVINFIPDRPAAIAEMRRVGRPDGWVAGYVWDFAQEQSPSGPLRRVMRQHGIDVPAMPGTEASRTDALQASFAAQGLERIETRAIEVRGAYENFGDFWQAQTPSYAPTTKIIAALDEKERRRLMRTVEAFLPSGPDGSIEYGARANAVKARVPAR